MTFLSNKAAAALFNFAFNACLVACLVACAAKPVSPERPLLPAVNESSTQSLDSWIRAQESKSWELLQLNISPTEPKVPGGPKPRAGIVVAALHRKDPDYYFHWVRDSSNVIRVVVEYYAAKALDPSKLHKQMQDFLELSQDLQLIHSPYGMGEPRYTVEGKVDTLAWSRPQYDGPALRALAVIRYLKDFEVPAEQRKLAHKVLLRDLDYVKAVSNDRGFDLWEELKAENYHTRLVQKAALLEGAQIFKDHERSPVPSLLWRDLDKHWDAQKGYLRSQLVIEKTDGYTKKNTDLDSAIVVAVIESGAGRGGHSVSGPRVQATVAKLEELFYRQYPLNQTGDQALGLGYGRYLGDVYYGGNPWPLITAYYAQFYYRLAGTLAGGEDFRLTKENVEFVRGLLPEKTPLRVTRGTQPWKAGSPQHAELMAACVRKADRILARLRSVTPSDGQMYEQFDKVTGSPVSSRGIGWAHSAFIAASLERDRTLKKISTR